MPIEAASSGVGKVISTGLLLVVWGEARREECCILVRGVEKALIE